MRVVMTDRDWADAPYVRVYQTIRDDPKFATVFHDDRAFAAWVRLLMDAEPIHPVHASLPAHLSRYARDVLVKAGLLLVSGQGFTLSGLAKEREGRALTGAERSQRFRDRHRGTPVTALAVTGVTDSVVTTATPRAGAGASASVSVLRSSSPEDVAPAREALTVFQEAVTYIEARTRRAWAFGPGSKVWDTLEPDLRDFGWPAVMAAMDAEKATFPDIAQLVFGASRRLHPISGAEKPAELDPEYVKRAVAAQRKPRPNGA